MTIERNFSTQYEQFELWVGDLFGRLGRKNVLASTTHKDSSGRTREIDIQFGEADEITVVEVKRYRYSSPPAPELFSRALKQTRFLQRMANAKHAILVMSCPLTEGLRATAIEDPSIEIWDAQKLFEQASPFPDLIQRLEELLEVNISDALQAPPETKGGSRPLVELLKGEELAFSLREIRPGRSGASEFESKCIEALKYLFDRDLVGWHEQHETEDRLHRRDLVCRILPNSEVWRLMVTDLKSRYVVFEFKNYSDPITQNEIVTTERYLYPSALRNLAIIISPQGCSPSAMRVIHGAMREHGKLILPLTISELASLLVGKDQGSDPNAFLFDRVDEFLLGLGR
jgi:hypothetical protein